MRTERNLKMTLAELLKSHGIADDVITKITADMKANKIFTTGEENLDIRYGKLETDFDNLTAQHSESTKLVEQLKAGAKDNEKLQGQITAYETQIADLKKQATEAALAAEIKVALLAAKATDVDYMTFKLKEKGELELDENGKIKGIDDKIAGLKTRYPNQFESASTDDDKDIDVNKLNKNKDMDQNNPTDLASAIQDYYKSN